MTGDLFNLTEMGRYLNVSTERARQVAADNPTFPAPAGEKPRRWSRGAVERWTERHWWDKRPWRKGAVTSTKTNKRHLRVT